MRYLDAPSAERLAVSCAFLFPFELQFSVVRNKLALAIGPVGLLFHPALFFAVACLLRSPMRTVGNRALLIAITLYATGLIVSGILTGSQPFYVISTVALGPVLIAVMIATIDDEEFLDRIIEAFVAGASLWSLIFAVWFAYTASKIVTIQPEIMDGLPLDRLFLWLRLPGALVSDFYYFKLLGNYNKQSNILVISLILSAYLYVKGRWSWRIWVLTTVPMSIMLLVMFSRGALTVLAIVAISLAFTALLHREKRQIAVAAAMAVVILASVSMPELRAYWHNIGSFEQRVAIMSAAASAKSGEFSASGEVVAVQPSQPGGAWIIHNATQPTASPPTMKQSFGIKDDSKCDAISPEPDLKFYLFGYGLGHFGPTVCRQPEGESHNAFMDSWVQGGILGMVGYVAIFLIGIYVGARRLIKTRFADISVLYGLAIVLAVMALALREYAFVYLWVQSAGGFLLAVGLALVTLARRDGQHV